MLKITPKGGKREQELFKIVNQHYDMGLEDLEPRFADWDTKLELFYSHIDESKWPYSSQIFVPQVFTALFEKMARLNGGKPRGRLIPREGGDVLKAKMNNELLNFQWDDAVRVDREVMSAKWARMDLNARLYGASFALVKWRYEVDSDGNTLFDGPVMKVLSNKDCIYNPAYSTVKNWFQHRDYLTIKELETVNDVCGEKPRYKNLSLLRDAVRGNMSGGDNRDNNYIPKGRSLLGLGDYLGKDEDPDFKIVEVVTEYRNDRTVVFAPKHGVILRDDVNPYSHNQIPIICLKYIPVDDDIYGLSEVEPVEKVQKALNALTSQFIDTINMGLYRILQVNPTAVQMHTMEWGPGKKWLMNNPGKDVVPLEHSMASTNQFVNVYSVLTQMFKEAMGEMSAAFSTMKPFGTDKTATEINSLEGTRDVRDGFNQVFLAEAIKEQMMFWLLMNKQFIFQDPEKTHLALRVVGRDSMRDFQNLGLADMMPDTSDVEVEGAMESILSGGMGEVPEVPVSPVNIGETTVPKFEMDETGEMGTLYLTPEDMVGAYDYIADVGPMQASGDIQEKKARMDAFGLITNPQVLGLLQQEGKTVNITDLLVDVLDASGIKDAEKYFETMKGGLDDTGTLPGGEELGQPGGIPGGAMQAGGMGNPQGMAGSQSIPQLG